MFGGSIILNSLHLMHYFPILKAKQGEIQALSQLSTSTKQNVWPILQVPPPSMSRPDRGQQSVLIPHDSASIQTCIKRLKTIRDIECFLDPVPAQLTFALLDEVVQQMALLSNPPYPVIQLNGSDAYLAAYRAQIGEPERYCLRLPNDASVDPNITTTLQRALRHYRLNPENGILLLDVADVSTSAANIVVYADNAAKMFKRTMRIPFEEQVLASGAFPITFSPTALSWTPLPYDRRDQELWRLVMRQVEVSFGDYAVSNPNNDPMPSYSGSPKARYTHNDHFWIIKGVAVGTHLSAMSAQYHRISKILTGQPIYSGAGFSWGDSRIDGCCNPASTSNGNLTTWVAINTNHHLEFMHQTLFPAASATPSVP